MKKVKKLSFFLLSLALLFFCTNPVKDMLTEPVTWFFHDLIAGVQHSEELLGLEPSLELDTIQTAGSIKFSLVIKNENDHSISLPNPIDHLQYLVLDEKELPFPVPPVPVRIKLSPEDWDTWENPFCPLIEVLKNATAQPVTEIQRLKAINVKAGETYTFSFQIKGTPSSSGENEQIRITPLPPGRYKLIVTYSLFLNTVPQSPNRLLQTDKILLQLQ